MQKNKKTIINFLILSCLLGLTSSCNKSSSEELPSGPTTVAETSTCITTTPYSVDATLSGSATFSKRGLTVGTSGGQVARLTLAAPISTPLPIRFAEIRVLNSSGAVVQCGKTNSTGQLKALDGVSDLKLPAVDGDYIVEVLARSTHTFTQPTTPFGKADVPVLFSIKQDIYSNEIYKLYTTVRVMGSTPLTAHVTASALESVSSKVEGGAFNIYNNIITSYEYLAGHTTTQDLSCLGQKLSGYWKAGFNPNQYIYPNEPPGGLSTISFYIRDEKELFINGGKMDLMSNQDTDHFDDSVIIHELGHHIENVCGRMESPGGTHSGAARIDPRLAWSEAWGNYFATHIIKNNLSSINPELVSSLPNSEWLYYFDSEGYSDGGSGTGYEYIKINLARVGSSNTTETLYTSSGTGTFEFDLVSSTTNPGEGHFREIAISRALFKATNTCLAPFANCVNQNNFSDIWKAFENTSTGMGQPIYPFRSSVKLLERFKTIKGGSLSAGLNTIFNSDEAMQLNGNSDYVTGGYLMWPSYGIKLVSGLSCNLKIKPKSNIGSTTKSDQRFSNHFYYLDLASLPGVTSITLSSSKITGQNLDVDALIFADSYSYNEDCSGGACSKSTANTVAANRAVASVKTVSLAGLTGSSKYLLNIRTYVPSAILSNTEYTYTLTDQNGDVLCPSNSL
jgi:hypothetical protein